MIDQVRRDCRRWQILPVGASTLVGVSGGADSLALLHLLAGWRRSLKLTLHAATLDHGLRGEAGAADASFVESLCHQLGVPCMRDFVDVPALAALEGIGIEAAGRLARYRFLGEAARNAGASAVAVAHHADDQAETVLMHLLRGAGLHGLGGMSPSTTLHGFEPIQLIRPLLGLTRQQIEVYCQQHDLQPRHDATNADTTLLRNKLRHQVLPQLEQVNPRVRSVLVQLAESVRLDDAFLDFSLAQELAPILKVEPGGLRLNKAAFSRLHPALARRAILHCSRQLEPTHEIDYLHVVEALELAHSGRLGSRALLSGGLQLRIDYHDLLIERAGQEMSDVHRLIPPATDLQLSLGDNPIEPGLLTLDVSIVPLEGDNLTLDVFPTVQLRLRTRRQGDRVAVGEHGEHHQKLSEWMINRKVPAAVRGQLPLICADDQILALYWHGWKTFPSANHQSSSLQLFLRFRNKL
jgi:tRNA(Ile)-lysidine synthase